MIFSEFIDNYTKNLSDIASNKIVSPFYGDNLTNYKAEDLQKHITNNEFPHYSVLAGMEFYQATLRSNYMRKLTPKDYYRINSEVVQGRIANLKILSSDIKDKIAI